jgi:phosphate transport system substrate-binding protein
MRKYAIAAATALVASVALAAPAAHAAESITATGASTQNAIQAACTAAYTTDKITYGGGGSTAGKTNFANGTSDFAGTDSFYSATATKPTGTFTYVPVIGVPIAFPFKLAGVTNLNLSAKVLGGILNGRYTTWDDAEIAKLNPSVKLPSTKITVVYRSTGSGTVNNVASFLAGNGATGYKANDAWATASSQATPVGLGAKDGAAISALIAATEGSIGYADLSDVAGKGLNYASVRNPNGEFVKPTPANSAKFLAVQKLAADGTLDLDYKKVVKGGYNATLVSYALASTSSTNAAKATAVKKYLTYFVNTCAPAKATALNYVAITGVLKASALKLIAKIK